MPAAYKQLREITDHLEKHYKDIQDFEFTIEDGTLYLLQTRTGKRTGAAAVKIACDMVREKLIYYPTVTREPFRHQGRLTHLIETGKLFADLGLPPLDPAQDRVMICGSPGLLKDACALLNARGFILSPHIGEPGHYVIERAFVEK